MKRNKEIVDKETRKGGDKIKVYGVVLKDMRVVLKKVRVRGKGNIMDTFFLCIIFVRECNKISIGLNGLKTTKL